MIIKRPKDDDDIMNELQQTQKRAAEGMKYLFKQIRLVEKRTYLISGITCGAIWMITLVIIMKLLGDWIINSPGALTKLDVIPYGIFCLINIGMSHMALKVFKTLWGNPAKIEIKSNTKQDEKFN